MKINWGTAMVIAMVLFMVFILQFVYRTLAMDEYDHELVSDDYYKDELYYQQEIDKINKANTLPENVRIERVEEGFVVFFPKEMIPAEISGTVSFQRPSDKKLDFQKEIRLKNHQLLIQDKRLLNGKWNVKVDWKHKDEEYLLKESIFY